MPANRQIRISAVVCTRNSRSRIAPTLESLHLQGMDPANFEVIVVENASNDGTREWLDSNADAYRFRVITEERLGLSHARNTGIAAASGELIFFVDDDAIVPAHFLRRMWELYEKERPDFIGGPVHGFWEHTPPAWLSPAYWRHLSLVSYGSQPKYLKPPDILIGTNVAIRREFLLSSGEFDPELGRKGDLLIGQEERVLQIKAMERGSRVYYHPDLYVYHLVSAERMTLDYFRRRAIGGALTKRLTVAAETGKKPFDPASDPLWKRPLRKVYDFFMGWVVGRYKRTYWRIGALPRMFRLMREIFLLEYTLRWAPADEAREERRKNKAKGVAKN